MSDFTPTPEVVEAVAEAMERVEGNPARLNPRTWEMLSKVAIAAFVEAEGFAVSQRKMEGIGTQTLLVGPWRKRHASPDATQ